MAFASTTDREDTGKARILPSTPDLHLQCIHFDSSSSSSSSPSPCELTSCPPRSIASAVVLGVP
eukprot:764168-Hanusia_phi.AAC.3